MIWSLDQLPAARHAFETHLAAGRDVEDLGVVCTRPTDLADFAFVGVAPKRPAGRRYRCSFCQTKDKFCCGRLVLSSDGGLRLIGDDCWSRHLDATKYEHERQDLVAHIRRQDFEARRRQIASTLTAGIVHVRSLDRGALYYIERLPHILREDRTGFAAMLERAAREGGNLYVDSRKPDPTKGYDSRGRPVSFVEDRRAVHVVQGIDAALRQSNPLCKAAEETLDRLYKAAAAIAAVPTTGENLHVSQCAAAAERRVSRIRNDLKSMAEVARQAQRFLSRENFTGLAGWSSHGDCDNDLAGAISTDGSTLTIVARKSHLVLSPPARLACLEIPSV